MARSPSFDYLRHRVPICMCGIGLMLVCGTIDDSWQDLIGCLPQHRDGQKGEKIGAAKAAASNKPATVSTGCQ
jgi:hypothetical protein